MPTRQDRTAILGEIVHPYQRYLCRIWADRLKHVTPYFIVQAHSAVFPITCLLVPPIFHLLSAHFELVLVWQGSSVNGHLYDASCFRPPVWICRPSRREAGPGRHQKWPHRPWGQGEIPLLLAGWQEVSPKQTSAYRSQRCVCWCADIMSHNCQYGTLNVVIDRQIIFSLTD